MKLIRKLMGITAGILAGICLIGGNLKSVQESREIGIATKEAGKENQENVEEQAAPYQEMLMPYDTKNYYEGTGIWKTMVDTDGTLFSYAKNDKTNQYMMISWNDRKQTEKVFPKRKAVPKKLIKGYPGVIPYSNGKNSGYLMYKKGKNGFLCYHLGKTGKVVREISLQSFLEQAIKNGSMGSTEGSHSYGITSMQQIKKNRIAVGIGRWTDTGYVRDCSWLFDINVKKNALISVEKCDYWLAGADSDYRYGIQIETGGYFHWDTDFANGRLIIEDRKTGKQAVSVGIPNDLVSKQNDSSAAQCLDIRDGVVWLANRTGVYRLKAGSRKWTRVMQPEQSSYLNLDYSLSDLTVVDEDTFYLLLLEGEDDESSTRLIKYYVP